MDLSKYAQLKLERISKNAVIVEDTFTLLSDGRVIGRSMKWHHPSKAYVIPIRGRDYMLAQMILVAFVGMPLETLHVEYIDGDRSNLNLNNLRWALAGLKQQKEARFYIAGSFWLINWQGEIFRDHKKIQPAKRNDNYYIKVEYKDETKVRRCDRFIFEHYYRKLQDFEKIAFADGDPSNLAPRNLRVTGTKGPQPLAPHNCKLSFEDVVFIRESFLELRKLADMFNVCKQTILNVRNKKTYTFYE